MSGNYNPDGRTVKTFAQDCRGGDSLEFSTHLGSDGTVSPSTSREGYDTLTGSVEKFISGFTSISRRRPQPRS